MHYRSLVIHFMSGTGNSFRAATWLKEISSTKGINSQLNQIIKINRNRNLGQGFSDLIGLIFPTHGFTAPWQVIKFALGLPKGRRKHAFVIATRAGTRIASIPFPDLEGTAAYLIALILVLKGYIVRGVMGLDMPSNWMSLHWGLNSVNSEFIINRAKVKTNAFFKSVLKGRQVFQGIISLFFGLILSPISIAYLFIGRFFLSKLFLLRKDVWGADYVLEAVQPGQLE